MSRLVKIDLEQVAARVQVVLKGFPQVAGAYLYGSALDFCRPDSDLDLGLVLVPEIKPGSAKADRLEAEISLALTPVAGHPFDIVHLNPDNILFTFRVIKEGKLCLEGVKFAIQNDGGHIRSKFAEGERVRRMNIHPPHLYVKSCLKNHSIWLPGQDSNLQPSG